ncbi:hypothetical protein ACFVT5_41500 [Streptomyces sp. NPDC058001]|uniref:hypothetical protein n=1 Tax=Streptomyces sp. NPDC058001 TaxID=3346300 RepID=UPI0036E4AD66
MNDSNAEEVPLPVPAHPPAWRDSYFRRSGLWARWRAGDRPQSSEVLAWCELAGRERAVLVYVGLHQPGGGRLGWFRTAGMDLECLSPTVTAAAEHDPCDGDASPADHGALKGDPQITRFEPARDCEVRIGGTWHPARMIRRYAWLDGQVTVVVWPRLWEPDWQTSIRYHRHYQWDSRTIQSRTA